MKASSDELCSVGFHVISARLGKPHMILELTGTLTLEPTTYGKRG